VIVGQIKAPAMAALAASTPNRNPKLFVFHSLASVVFDKGRSGTAMEVAASRGADATGTATSRVMLSTL
jgi:hypothetical protein